MSKQIRVTIEDTVADRLDQFCQSDRRSLSNAVNLLLDDGLTKLGDAEQLRRIVLEEAPYGPWVD
jgi:hypothetical protein